MHEIKISELNINPITLIGQKWMLITAGKSQDSYNTMTASWGQLGHLWNKDVSTIYVRPQRYTKKFVDQEEYYTLSFFDDNYQKALAYLGSHSGKDEDKVSKVGLTPIFADGYSYFKEAKLVIVCKKLYHAPVLEKGFYQATFCDSVYPQKDFHEMYVGEIIKVLAAD